MDSKPRYKSSLAFTDLLFNVLIGFAFLFIIAFILINPITEEANIKAKAEFMVIMEWDDKSNYDIDLWMQDPLGTIVGFPNKEAGWLHLDKDDLGTSNDTVTMRDGTTKTIFLNREIMTVRGIAAGEYIVNIHLYSTKGQNTGPMPVNVSILKINPFGEIHNGVTTLNINGEEATVLRFTINATGYVISKNKLQKRFAGKHLPGGGAGMTSGNSSVGRADEMMQHDMIDDVPADDDEVHESSGSHPDEFMFSASPSGTDTNISNTEIGDIIPDQKEEHERRSFMLDPGGSVVETEEDVNRYDGQSHPNSDSESDHKYDPALGGF